MSETSHQRDRFPSSVVERNVEALIEKRAREERDLSWQERLAERITRFTGSMRFVWLHLAAYGAWIFSNSGAIPGLPVFDPSFVMLAMVASVEAIFLSTFILISQNRMQALADRRAELNLQISLLTEHEVTRVLEMVSEIGQRMGVPAAGREDIAELTQDIKPEAVLDHIETRSEELAKP